MFSIFKKCIGLSRAVFLASLLFFTQKAVAQSSGKEETVQEPKQIARETETTKSFYSLKGTILNKERQPIQGATITLYPGLENYLTDTLGHFSAKLQVGVHYEITIRSTGHQTVRTLWENGKFKNRNLEANNKVEETWLLKDSIGNLTDVKVRALNEKEQLKNAPIKANIVDMAAQQQKAASLIELLNRSAGVRIRQTGGLGANSEVMLNGFQNKAVRFFKDGIPTDYLGAAFDLASLPVNTLDHVEIYKGVLPTYLGADALGGAINLVTKQPKKSFLGASYEVGSFNTHRLTLDGQYRSSNQQFMAGISAYFNYSDNNYGVDINVRDSSSGVLQPKHAKLFHNKFNSYYVEGFIGWMNTSWADLLKLSISNFDIHKQFQFGATMDKPFGQAKGEQYSVVPTILYRKSFLNQDLQLEQFVAANTLTTHTVDTAGGHYDWDGHFTKNPSEGGELSTRGSLSAIDYSYLLSRTSLSYRINPAHKISANIVYNQYKRKGKDPLGQQFTDGRDVLSLPAKYLKIVGALGIQSQFIPKRLENNLIGKFYYYRTSATDGDYKGNPIHNRNNHSSWGIADGLKLALNENSFVNLSAETALRLPQQDELFGDGGLKLSNFGLKPERSLNINLGYKTFVAEKYGLEVNAFYRHTKDLILLMPINFIYSQSQNVDEVRGEGLDFDARYYFFPWLNATGNFTYQNLRLVNTGYGTTEGARLKNTPYFFANTGLNASFHHLLHKDDLLNVYWLFSYVREYYLDYIPKSVEPKGFLGLFGRAGIDARNIIPDQRIHTLGLNYFPARLPVSIGMELKDLFNAKIFDQFKIQNPGRSIFLKLNYSIK